MTHADAAAPELRDLYRAHAAFVWRTVRRTGVAQADVEDVMHEVFMVVMRKLPEFDRTAAVRPWLYGIARRVCANHHRGRARAARKLAVVPPPAEPPSPEAHTERARRLAHARTLVAELDDAKREVFVLSDVEGMPGTEIAKALGLNLNTVYARLRAARRAFESGLEAIETGAATEARDV